MLKLDINRVTRDFVSKLQPKQYKQIIGAIFDLMVIPTPNDSAKLKGYDDFYRKDVGEFRIIYQFDSETLFIILVGHRNDSDVYKKLKRQRG